MKKLPTAIIVAVLALTLSAMAVAGGKYKRYTKQSLSSLLEMCVEGDDTGCYFYAGMQAKRGNYKEAHDAYLVGAETAKSRAGFVSMLKLAQLYRQGKGVQKDLVQAYRWYTVVAERQKSKDLRVAADGHREKIAREMTKQQIAFAEALSKAWK